MPVGLNRIRFAKYPVQERKLNFFADYYQYFVHFAGQLPAFEIETPYALVDKIIFQLNHNLLDKAPTYLKNHFAKLKAYPKGYTKNFVKYKPVIQWYDGWRSAGTKSQYLITHLSSLKVLLAELEKELEVEMLKSSIESLKNMILCNHPLEQHIDAIAFHSRLLASGIIIKRKSRAEARELFDVVMTNEYNKFPYPKHISTDDAKREFFSKKTIKETLDAIGYFSEKEPEEWDVNFKISDIIMPEGYVFSHGKVKIYPADHPDKKAMIDIAKAAGDPYVESFFTGSEYAIAEVRVDSVTYEGAHRNALKDLSSTLDFMEVALGRNFSFQKGDYLFSTDRKNYGYWFKAAYQHKLITSIDQIKLDDNAYQFFEKNPSSAKQEFLAQEMEYIKARGDVNIARLWGYLEVLFNDKTVGKGIKGFCSGALMLYEKQFRFPQVYSYLRNAIHPMNTGANDIGLTIDEQFDNIRKDSDFKELNQKIKSDFFRLAIKDLYVRRTKKWVTSQRNAYYALLEEAYEQRNMQDHGGKMNAPAFTKLTYTLPLLTVRMRWVVFGYIKRHPTYNFNQIVQAIRDDVNAKIGPYRP
ncbi:hypothetical protein SAMN04488505_10726 [Chitinophaga rupis]|uniref:Uncharacterized protein n=1 Tax=Chitinophaga rupis TaxID=573321 RepID=A0A1H8CAT5_9BACT|nr:hypothetical protein [Chitinophaga rupis]SEM91217.1 hypothetical protein SAMN04488505_10726 [Chitinophaga rupis]